ncbi:MAG: alanine racemase [Candidatus Latescibacterota bacterium]|nr:alanine racemase [Candidatus Latescibacterota bacterium]
MIEQGPYRIANPDGLETPAMVVFQQQLDHNISSLCEMVGGGDNLMVHVKTHKAEVIARKQLAAGIAGFKCATLKELEMVLEAGASEAILAYPMVQRVKIERFAELCARFSQAHAYATVGEFRHVEALAEVALDRQQVLRAMVDLDVGMHRTGVRPEGEAEETYRLLHSSQWLEAGGLHAYDGHEHFSDSIGREAAANQHIEVLQALKDRLEAESMPCPRIVAGGSFSFPYYARAEGFHGSPGTVVYWDLNGTRRLKDWPFQYAALVLCQIVDRYPDQGTVTTDLGVKSIAADPPLESRVQILGHPGARLILQNEEHGVFTWPGDPPELGGYLLAVPGHVCPTTIRYPGSYVIDAEGAVVDYYPHTARDRQ